MRICEMHAYEIYACEMRACKRCKENNLEETR
jgi:hypothetical protein